MLEETSGPELLSWFDQNPSWDPRLRFAGFDGPRATKPAAAPHALDGSKFSACRMGSQLSVDLSLAALAFASGAIAVDSESTLDGVPESFLGPMA